MSSDGGDDANTVLKRSLNEEKSILNQFYICSIFAFLKFRLNWD